MSDIYRNDQDLCLDWDATIEDDGQEFITLEEGDYNFTVTGFDRGRFPGGPKIPACNKATVTMQVKTKRQNSTALTRLRFSGKRCAVSSIGRHPL